MSAVLSLYLTTQKDISKNTLIYWGTGWSNKKSEYDGSEFGFAFTNSGTVSVEYDLNSKSDQGIDVVIDGKNEPESASDTAGRIRTFSVDPKKNHTVSVRYYCTHLYDPCSISIIKIIIERKGKVYPYKPDKPVLSVLGDSISTMYGIRNYTRILSDTLNVQLHNASRMGSTISHVPEFDSAALRYEKEILPYGSAVVIIFLGTNDAKIRVPPDVFYENYSAIVRNMIDKNPGSKIFLAGILPRKDIDADTIAAYNTIISGVARLRDVSYIDTSDWITAADLADDIHPSADGQKKIADRFFQVIKYAGK